MLWLKNLFHPSAKCLEVGQLTKFAIVPLRLEVSPSPQSKHYSLEISVTVRGDTINIGGLTQDHSTMVAVCPKNIPYCDLPVLVLVLQMTCFE